MSRQLSQQEIDAVFQNTQGRRRAHRCQAGGFCSTSGVPTALPSRSCAPSTSCTTISCATLLQLIGVSPVLLIINLVSVEQLYVLGGSPSASSPTCIDRWLKALRTATGSRTELLLTSHLEILLGGDGKLLSRPARDHGKSSKCCSTGCSG